jgi:hypothetical protein
MPDAPAADLVIRSRLTTTGAEFIVVCGSSAQVLGGPFPGMSEAVGFAVSRAASAKSRILYEAHDERGRAVGERLVLRTTY